MARSGLSSEGTACRCYVSLVTQEGFRFENIPLERERARATTAAQLLVLAAAALAAKRPFSQLSKQRRAAPDLAEALRAQIAGHLGEVGTGREFAVGGDATVLRAARATRPVVQDGRIRVRDMHVPHEMRRALRPNHQLPAILALPARQICKDGFVFGR